MQKTKLLLLTLLLALISIGVQAQVFNYTANGREWRFILDTDGTAILVGVMEPAATCSGTLNIPDDVIDNGGVHHTVTHISQAGFYNYKLITEVNIPSSVKTIGESAFSACEGLVAIGMSGVESIRDYAFSNCKNLTNVNMAPKTIGNGVFSNCKNLASVDLSGVESLGDGAFVWSGVTSVTFGHNLTEIPSNAFAETPLVSITIPSEVTTIGQSAFQNCQNLVSVNLPDGLTTIGDRAFRLCKALTSLTIPSTVTSIGTSIIVESNLNYTNIHYPSSLLKQIIENGSFMGTDWVGTTFDIPSDVTKIGREAFHGCTSWTKTNLTLENLPVGFGAFWGCTGLTGTLTLKDCTFEKSNQESAAFKDTKFNHLVLGTNNETLDMSDIRTIFGSVSTYPDYNVFLTYRNANGEPEDIDLTILEGPKEIMGTSFWYWLKNVHFPNTDTSIGGFFSCCGITNVHFPTGLKTIKYGAFGGCGLLTLDGEFPSSVERIEAGAFSGCSKLHGDARNFLPTSLKSLGTGAFANCSGITGEAVIPPLLPVLEDDYALMPGNPFVNTGVYGLRLGVQEKFFKPYESGNIMADWQQAKGLLYVDARDCKVALTNDKGEPNTAYKFSRTYESNRYRNFTTASINTLIYLPSEAKFNDPALPVKTFDERFSRSTSATFNPQQDASGENFIMDGKCKYFYVADGYPYRVPIAFTALEAQYDREFNVTDGKAVSTLYLPYPTDLPAGMRAYYLTKKGFDVNGDKAFIFLPVADGTRLEANKPYIVQITDGQPHKLPVMHNVEVPVSPGSEASGVMATNDTDWKFYGTTERIDNADAYAKKAFYLNGNKWWQVQNGVENDYIAPFRCFVSSPTGAAAARSFVMVLEDDSSVTGIRQLEGETQDAIRSGRYPFYSVDGRLMGRDYDALERGQIYIVNGKKFYKF